MSYIGTPPGGDAVINTHEYIATAGQTTFEVIYDRYVEVDLNGKELSASDFTATSGMNVILTVGAAAGDIVKVKGFESFRDNNYYNKSEIDTNQVAVTGNQSIAGVKTFTSSPVVPDAVGAGEALNRGKYSLLSNSFIKPSQQVLFTKTAPADFTIPIGFKVTVGITTVEVTSTTTLSLNTNLDIGTKTAGTDYYVYAKVDSTFYISADKTITADRLIGGFHYGLVAEAEAVTGNKLEADMVAIRGINQYSFWDLKFRPVANPEGMVHINGRWYDIYLLNSEHITNGSSKAGAVIAGGAADTTNYRAIPKIPLEFGGDGTTNYGKFTWFQACEIAKAHSKELISYSEFPTIAYGVNEGKSSSTDGYEVVVGKIEHYSNLTSKWGIEQATGTQWIWGKDVGGNRDEGSTAWVWRTALTDNRGDIYALHDNHITAVLLGAGRAAGVNAGSRASGWSNYVWNSGWSVGSRFCSEHMEVL